MNMMQHVLSPADSAYAQRPNGYRDNPDPVIDSDQISCEELTPSLEERQGGIVRVMRIIAGRCVVIVSERADSIVNSEAFRIRTIDTRSIEWATGEARTRVRDRLFQRPLMGLGTGGKRK